MANWIKQLVDEKRTRDAKARALALLALGSANPTEDELGAFKPGQAIDPLRNVTGATGTEARCSTCGRTPRPGLPGCG